MRKSYISIAVASMVASLALVGCGSSSSSSDTTVDTPSSNSLVRESGIAKKVVLAEIPAPLTNEEKSRITSYNVCYTKLLRFFIC